MYRLSNEHSDAVSEKPYLVSKLAKDLKDRRMVADKKVTNVLIVDDDIAFRDLICDILVEHDEFNIVSRCGSYVETKAFCSNESNMKEIDAIILDVMLPYNTYHAPESKMGLVILDKLRNQLKFQGPIIVLTNSNDGEDGREALATGCSGYLCKHASPDAIERMVAELKLALTGEVFLVSSKLRHLIVENKNSDHIQNANVINALGQNPAWTDIKMELGYESQRNLEPSSSDPRPVKRTGEWGIMAAQNETGLGASATLVKHVMDNAPRPILITTTDGIIEFANLAAEKMFGYEQADLVGEKIQVIFPTLDSKALVTGTEFECYVRGASGVKFPVSVATSAFAEGADGYCIHIFTDLTSQKITEQRLKSMVSELEKSSTRLQELVKSDPLTGLLNRRGLETVLSREVSLARRNHTEVIAILVDLDNFKGINDTFGHAGGDLVLKNVAKVMKDTLRTSDWVGRIGGDEFMIFLPATELENGLMIAERIRVAVADSRIRKDGTFIHATTSIGVARLPLEVTSLEQVLELTKSGLKSSKRSGKNTVSLSTDGFSQASLKAAKQPLPKLGWLTDLTGTVKTWCAKSGVRRKS